MLRLLSKNLTLVSLQHLDAEKRKIQAKRTFEEKVKESARLWESKTNGAGAQPFTEIRYTLDSMSPAPGICCYCENNEGTDIEHIDSKRVFPEMTFDWDNYLLACTRCNSTHKSDQASVFDPAGSTTAINVTPRRKVYTPPPTNDSLFINPRKEDPQQFLYLELFPQTFLFKPVDTDTTSRNYQRAVYTRNTVNLNRGKLLEAREAAARDYVALLSCYDAVCLANTFDELDEATKGIPSADRGKSFVGERERIKYNLRQSFKRKPHPTVWAEIRRHQTQLPNMNRLFQKYPEALTW